MKFDDFMNKSWTRYSQITPDAPVIHKLLEEKGENVINDHVAYRTFNVKGIDRLSLGSIFEKWGYKKIEGELDFPEKKLKANYWIHADKTYPKIFISELLLEKFSKELQDWIHSFTNQIQNKSPFTSEVFLERSWKPIEYSDYKKFYEMSEYAAWTAAFGIQVNHFTVLVNSLKTFPSLENLNKFLTTHGMTLNEQGGVVKGTPQELLEQSSTIAKRIPWEFAHGEKPSIMGCYYEFAKRYKIPGTENLFQGFIPKSANKIFESTFEKHEKR